MNVRDSLLRFALVAPLVILAAACTRPNPRYCDEKTACADPALPYCNKVTHECGAAPDGGSGCNTDNDCPDSVPKCTAAAMCTTCTPGTDNSLCQRRNTATPVCDTTGACRACQKHSDCASKACLPDGQCAPEDQVAFVDNGGQLPATCLGDGGTHDGSATHPYCDIQDALGATPLKPYIVVAGSAEPYGPVTIANMSVTLLGPRPKGTSTAMITPITNEPVAVSGEGKVVLDGFEVRGALGITKPGITCSTTGTMSLTVTRSFIHDNIGIGVVVNTCTVTLDANTIDSNSYGGIKLTSSPYTITNNIIARNGMGVGPGVLFDSESQGTFAFNTVTQNGKSNNAGGINCASPAQAREIVDSIVFGNTATMSPTQFANKCHLVNVVTGTDTFSGAIQQSPTLTSDFRLAPNGNDFCVDKATSHPATVNSDHDVDFDSRPQGAGWDIGADELAP